MLRLPPRSTRTDTLFPYTTLFRFGELPLDGGGRQLLEEAELAVAGIVHQHVDAPEAGERDGDRRLGLRHFGDVELQRQHAPAIGGEARFRSEERRVGKACVSTCRSRWSPYH